MSRRLRAGIGLQRHRKDRHEFQATQTFALRHKAKAQAIAVVHQHDTVSRSLAFACNPARIDVGLNLHIRGGLAPMSRFLSCAAMTSSQVGCRYGSFGGGGFWPRSIWSSMR